MREEERWRVFDGRGKASRKRQGNYEEGAEGCGCPEVTQGCRDRCRTFWWSRNEVERSSRSRRRRDNR